LRPNTLDFGSASFDRHGGAYYTSGYNYSAENQGNVSRETGLVPTNGNHAQ
jgi:iron complex outermembrane receptor protein